MTPNCELHNGRDLMPAKKVKTHSHSSAAATHFFWQNYKPQSSSFRDGLGPDCAWPIISTLYILRTRWLTKFALYRNVDRHIWSSEIVKCWDGNTTLKNVAACLSIIARPDIIISYPTKQCAISGPQNPRINEFYEAQKIQSTDFETLTLWIVRSGTCS